VLTEEVFVEDPDGEFGGEEEEEEERRRLRRPWFLP